jgi:hypothetical protein
MSSRPFEKNNTSADIMNASTTQTRVSESHSDTDLRFYKAIEHVKQHSGFGVFDVAENSSAS